MPGYVVESFEIAVEPGQVAEVIVEMKPAQLALDEIVVTPSFISLLREEPVTGLALDRDDIFALPHLGDDIFRAMTLLPGGWPGKRSPPASTSVADAPTRS